MTTPPVKALDENRERRIKIIENVLIRTAKNSIGVSASEIYHKLESLGAFGLDDRRFDGAETQEGWIETTDRLPEKPGTASYEYVECLIWVRGHVEIGQWNCEHLCWDDDHRDDFRYHPHEPSHWRPLPEAPESRQANGNPKSQRIEQSSRNDGGAR